MCYVFGSRGPWDAWTTSHMCCLDVDFVVTDMYRIETKPELPSTKPSDVVVEKAQVRLRTQQNHFYFCYRITFTYRHFTLNTPVERESGASRVRTPSTTY